MSNFMGIFSYKYCGDYAPLSFIFSECKLTSQLRNFAPGMAIDEIIVDLNERKMIFSIDNKETTIKLQITV